MRRLLVLLAVFALILSGVWLGAETLLARKLRAMDQQDASIRIGSVSELRELDRIGLHLDNLHVDDVNGSAQLPMLEAWIAPTSPATGHLGLPPQIALETPAGPFLLGLSETQASLGLRPFDGLSIGHVELHSGPLTLNDTALAEGARLAAELTEAGDAAPPGAMASYKLLATVEGLSPGLLAPDFPPELGLLQLDIDGQVWLDGTLDPGHLSPETRPASVGLKIASARLNLGQITARVMGQIQPDAQGLTQGRIAVYTGDGRHLLEAAAQAGLIPQQAATLGVPILDKIASIRMNHAGSTEAASDPGGFDFPEPAANELRLPLTFQDGRMSLGPLPLGAAPPFPR